MSTLTTQLRNKLERTVIKARDAAESGAKEALESLAVHHHEPYGHMNGCHYSKPCEAFPFRVTL